MGSYPTFARVTRRQAKLATGRNRRLFGLEKTVSLTNSDLAFK